MKAVGLALRHALVDEGAVFSTKGSVRWEVGRSRIKQTLTPTAPTPYLDKAVYQLGLRSANNGTNQISKLPVNSQYNFVRGGGVGSAI